MRVRVWISLLTGLAVGMLVWMLPPLPHSTFRIESLQATNVRPFELQAVSSDAKHVFVYYPQRKGTGPAVTEVWDCQSDLKAPWIAHTGEERWLIRNGRLSPDEAAFAASVFDKDGQKVVVYDLASGRVKNEYRPIPSTIFFSPAGTLLADCVFESRDLETNQVERRLPANLDGFRHMGPHRTPYVLYRRGNEIRVFSLLAEGHLAELTLPDENMMLMQVFSQDGLVIRFGAFVKGVHRDVLVDFRDGVRQTLDDVFGQHDCPFTPDGRVYARFEECKSPLGISELWSGKDTERVLRVMRWADDTELGRFRNIKQACFSPKGNLLAVMREDHSFAIYDFPFRKPWGLIVAAVLIAMCCTWSLAWLWSRWVRRLATSRQRNAEKTANAPDSAALDR